MNDTINSMHLYANLQILDFFKVCMQCGYFVELQPKKFNYNPPILTNEPVQRKKLAKSNVKAKK